MPNYKAGGGVVYKISGDNTQFQKDTEQSKTIAAAASVAIGNLFAQAFLRAAGAVKDFAADIYKTGVEFESAFAGVEKTVGATTEQLSSLRQGIIDLSKEMPSAAADIASVAEAAGQLGVKTDDILDFTKVMVNLGVATDLTADEAATALAKIANITGLTADKYSNLGSAIVALGNNFAATESEIVAMTNRLASAGTLAGLTETEMLALATAMTAVGIEAEAGGSSMSQTLSQIGSAVDDAGNKLNTLASVSGMTAQQFATMWGDEPIKALQAFITGLNGVQESGGNTTAILEDLGMTGIRQSNMIQSLALASDTLSAALDTANTGWEENTALTEEASKRYATTESKAQMLKNQMNALKISLFDELKPAINGGITLLTNMAKVLGKLAPLILPVTAGLSAFALTKVGLTAAYSAITKITTGYKALSTAVALYDSVEKLATASTAYLSTALTAKEILVAALTGKISIATAAQALWNATMAANPIGAMVTILAALVSVTVGLAIALNDGTSEAEAMADSAKQLKEETDELVKSVQESREAYEEQKSGMTDNVAAATSYAAQLRNLMEIENKSSAQKAQLRNAVAKLNEIMPELNLAYDEQADSISGAVQNIDVYIAKMKEQAKAEAMQERLIELYKQQYELEQKRTKALEQNGEAAESYAKSTEAMVQGTDEYSIAVQSNIGDLYHQNKAVKDSEEAIKILDSELESVNSEINTLSEGLVTNQEAQDGLQASLEESIEPIDQYTEAQQRLSAALEATGYDIEDANNKIAEYTDTFVNGFEKIDGKSDLTFEKLKANMESNLALAQNWTENLGSLTAKGLDEGLLKALRDLGPQSNSLLASILKGNEQTVADNIASLNDIYRQMGETSIDAFLAEIGYTEKTENAGSDAAESTAQGLRDSDAVENSGRDTIVRTKGIMIQAVENVDFTQVGNAISSGIAKGIYNGENLVSAAAGSVAKRAYTAAMRALDAHSPSRLLEKAGMTVPTGLAKGIKKEENAPIEPVEDIVSNLQRRFSFAPVELALSNAANIPSTTNLQPQFNINLSADMEVDGIKLGRVVLKNFDDAASFTLRG